MRYQNLCLVTAFLITVVSLTQCTKEKPTHDKPDPELVSDGKSIFRFDTFGDEEFWSGLLHLDKAIAGFTKVGKELGVLK